MVGWDDPIDVNDQKRVRNLLNWHVVGSVVIGTIRLLCMLQWLYGFHSIWQDNE